MKWLLTAVTRVGRVLHAIEKKPSWASNIFMLEFFQTHRDYIFNALTVDVCKVLLIVLVKLKLHYVDGSFSVQA